MDKTENYALQIESKNENSKETRTLKGQTLNERFNMFRIELQKQLQKGLFTNYYGINYKIVKKQDALQYLQYSDIRRLNHIKYNDPMLKGLSKSKEDLVVSVIDYESVDDYFDYRVIT